MCHLLFIANCVTHYTAKVVQLAASLFCLQKMNNEIQVTNGFVIVVICCIAIKQSFVIVVVLRCVGIKQSFDADGA